MVLISLPASPEPEDKDSKDISKCAAKGGGLPPLLYAVRGSDVLKPGKYTRNGPPAPSHLGEVGSDTAPRHFPTIASVCARTHRRQFGVWEASTRRRRVSFGFSKRGNKGIFRCPNLKHPLLPWGVFCFLASISERLHLSVPVQGLGFGKRGRMREGVGEMSRVLHDGVFKCLVLLATFPW
jgi:hypothetical protein